MHGTDNNAWIIFVGKHEGSRLYGRPGHRWKCTAKTERNVLHC